MPNPNDEVQIVEPPNDDVKDADDPRNTSLSLLIKMAEESDEHDLTQQQLWTEK